MKRKGRKRKPNVIRTPAGQISRSNVSRALIAANDEADAVMTATWKRRTVMPSLTVHEARGQELGSVLHRMKARGEAIGPDEISAAQFEALQKFGELHHAYMASIGAKSPRSAADHNGPSGYDGSDPFNDDQAARDQKTAANFKAARKAVLTAGPFCHMAVEAVVIGNQMVPNLIADLRLAANALTKLFRIEAPR